MLGDYSEFENICKVLVCNELVKSNYGICLIVFQQVSHLSCAPAVTDDDHADKDIMKRKPIDPDQGMFIKHFTTRVIIQSLIIGLTTLAAYMIGMKTSVDVARTMTFAVMVFCQFTIIFSIRSGHNWFTHKMFTNRWLWLTIVFVTALTLIVLLVPGMQSLFKLAPMTSGQWWTVIGLSFGVLALSELFKLFTRKKGR